MRYTILTGIATLLVVLPAFGHHSGAMFDFGRTVVLEGSVLDWQYTNPHAWLQLLVPDENGDPVEWSVEFGTPQLLALGGIRYNTFIAGDEISLGLHPLKDGSPGGFFHYAILSDGQILGNIDGEALELDP